MSAPVRATTRLPSITATTVRRGVVGGRLYLAIGTLIVVILTVVLLRSAKASTVFATTYPLEVPLFATLGAMGGLMIFVSDRSKGVLEYLISYGVPPRSLFANALVTTAALTSIVLGVALVVGVGGYVASGHTVDTDLENSLLGYTIPMAYASALFATTAGVIWSSLSTARMGVNSPVGVAPMVGIAPPLIVLVLAESVAKAQYYYVTVGASAGFVVLVVLLLLASTSLLGRERYLSMM